MCRFFFFFKQKTAYEMRISDWSSDVCSSDLGDLAAALATDVEAKGGSLRLSDLQAYEAEWQEPLSVAYRAARFHVTPRLTAGPTIADAFTRLENGFTPGERPDGTAFAAYAAAPKVGSASCRGRVCQDVSIPAGAGILKKKKTQIKAIQSGKASH